MAVNGQPPVVNGVARPMPNISSNTNQEGNKMSNQGSARRTSHEINVNRNDVEGTADGTTLNDANSANSRSNSQTKEFPKRRASLLNSISGANADARDAIRAQLMNRVSGYSKDQGSKNAEKSKPRTDENRINSTKKRLSLLNIGLKAKAETLGSKKPGVIEE